MPRKPKAPDPPKRRSPGTGSVVVRGDGRIAVYLPKDLDPKRLPQYGPGKRQRFTSPEQAGVWLDAEIHRRRNPTSRAATLAEPLGAYLTRWWKLYSPGWPTRTAAVYRRRLRCFATIADVALGELTHEVVMGAIAALQTATWRRHKRGPGGTMVAYGPAYPYSPATIRSARSVLHQALEQLVPHVLTGNPVKRVKLGKVQEAQQRVWDAEQVDRFEAAALKLRPDLYFPIRLITRRALRRGEVLSIERTDIDRRRRIVTVAETAGDRVGETDDTKGRQIRDIPLGELSADEQRHVMRQTRPSRWLVPGRFPDKPLSLRQFSVVIDQIITAAGLPRITPKDMRATAATILLDENVSLARVSRLLGHSSIAVTSAFYDRVLKLTQARVDHLADELDQAFSRASRTAREQAPTPISEVESAL